MDDTYLTIDQWTVHLRRPDDFGPYPVIVLLHGLTGDENSMWFFTSRLPKSHLLIAPRAPHPVSTGGFSWREYNPNTPQVLPTLDDFRDSLKALNSLLTTANFPVADFSQMHLVGFSQGAAMSYAYALMFPERTASVVAMAGFVPSGCESLVEQDHPLAGKQVLIAHGREDKVIPISLAYQAYEIMQSAGARVTNCEDNVGHKMGLKCLPVLEDFFK